MGHTVKAPAVGPVEAALLAQLAPAVTATVHWLPGGGALRALEAGSGPTMVLRHGRGGERLARSLGLGPADAPGRRWASGCAPWITSCMPVRA